MKKIITSESTTIGHPDKLADIIADTILDECLAQDAASRVACEVMLAHNKVFIAGEITTLADVDYASVAKEVIRDVGYCIDGVEFECRVNKQSSDIAQAVDQENQGAGDQGVMVGYATDETLSYMPLSAALAHRLTKRLEECRRHSIITGLLPDGKAQVSISYQENRFDAVESIILSAQHISEKDIDDLRTELMEKVILYCLKDYNLSGTEILLNPSGRFVIGGFQADTGLTGRKLMVDSYGGAAHHGGGAFSGKDASKVDRSGAYMARYIAKNIVAAHLARECEVTLSYAIGQAEPTAIDIDTHESGVVDETELLRAVRACFDLTPKGISQQFGLTLPIFAQTAAYGHFGRDYFLWELTNKTESLKKFLGK